MSKCFLSFVFVYAVKVNGFVCKDPMAVNADDFFKAANLDKPMITLKSKVGSNVTLINACHAVAWTQHPGYLVGSH